MSARKIDRILKAHGLAGSDSLAKAYKLGRSEDLRDLIYWPDKKGQTNSLEYGLALLGASVMTPPRNLLPLMPLDDLSLACVACPERGSREAGAPVVRWHTGDVSPEQQAAVLDLDAQSYLKSVRNERQRYDQQYEYILRVAGKYYDKYVAKLAEVGGKPRRPKSTELRPVQLACQNVIVGLAVLQHDVFIDGLRVRAFLTCEVPHLATGEAIRAMAALLLCDTFQSGGTMEIRFGSPHKETPIPAALLRYGRCLGIRLGAEDGCSITPAEARELFWAVTPMPAELRSRCCDVIDHGLIRPERLCYILMAGVWSAAELDFILATSSRSASILRGGAPSDDSVSRQVERETCRCALMVGMLHRHLSKGANVDAGPAGAEDDGRYGVDWQVLSDYGAVVFSGPGSLPVSWSSRGLCQGEGADLICLPRALPLTSDFDAARSLQEAYPDFTVAVVVPSDSMELVPTDLVAMQCPDRLLQLDATADAKMNQLRLGRS